MLNGLDGSYLHCEKRLSDANPFDLIWFEDSKRGDVAAFLQHEDCRPYLAALESTAKVIDGFESPLGMELLATVDWIVSEMHCEPNLAAVMQGLKKWPGASAARRKVKLFDDRLLSLALERLAETGLASGFWLISAIRLEYHPRRFFVTSQAPAPLRLDRASEYSPTYRLPDSEKEIRPSVHSCKV